MTDVDAFNAPTFSFYAYRSSGSLARSASHASHPVGHASIFLEKGRAFCYLPSVLVTAINDLVAFGQPA